MYVITIYNDGMPLIIHEPGTSDVKVGDAKISREVNAFDSLSFTIYPDNPGWSYLTPFATTIEARNLKTGNLDFEGRVLQPVPDMDSDGMVCKTVTCEGLMAYLCDSSQRYVEEQHFADEGDDTGLQLFIDLLLERHNAAVEEHKRIYRGNVTLQTFDTSGGVTKAVERKSTWDNMSDKLIGSFGGEMAVRRGIDGLLYLDYAENLGTVRATRIELGRNMVDSQSEADIANVITRLYPYGSKVTVEEVDEEGNVAQVETEERIGIETVNNGLAYVDDTVAMAAYGIIEGVQEWDDVTTPARLLSKARDWLGDNNALPVSHTVTALDLSLLGLDIDEFRIHDSYPCVNRLTGMDEVLEIVKQTIDVNSPEDSSFEMGETSYRLSGEIQKPPIWGDFEDFQSQTNTNITNVQNSIVTTAASIKVAVDAILSEVSQTVTTTNGDVQTIKDQITQMIQDIDGWTFNFTEIEQTVTDINTTYGEQLKYIKFIGGEIWLGRDADPGQDDFKVVISNERIRFLQNNIEIAYLSNNQLYITNAEVLDTLVIGAFEWAPRDNGNMTLRLR